MARTHRVGADGLRRLGQGARVAFHRSFALLALIVLAAVAQGQGAEELNARVVELSQQLRAGDEVARYDAFDELLEIQAMIEDELRAGHQDAERLHLVAYKCASYRAELGDWMELEARFDDHARAIDHADASGFADPRMRARLIRAELRMLTGSLDEARASLLAALDEVSGAEGTRPFVLYALAEADVRLGSYRAALQHLDQAEAARPEGPAWATLAWRIAGTRGQVYLDLGVPDVAAPFLAREQDGVEQARAAGVLVANDAIAAHLHAANLALARGQDARVVQIVDSALAEGWFEDLYRSWQGVLLGVQGEALVRLEARGRGEAGRARAVLERALDFELPRRSRISVGVHAGLAALHAGDVPEARRCLGDARERLDASLARAELTTLPEEAQLARAEARLALATGDSAALERALAALDGAVRRRRDAWLMAPVRLGGLGLLHHPARRAWLSELTRIALRVLGEDEGTRRALAALNEVQALGGPLRRAGVSEQLATRPLEDFVQALLLPRRGWLVYLPGPDQSHVLGLDGDGAFAIELPSEHVLLDAVAEWRRSDSAGPHLTELLIPSELATRVAGWEGATLLGRDLLGGVSFERLPLPEGGLLGESLSLDELPSLALGLFLAERGPNAPRSTDAAFVVASEAPASVRARWPELESLSVSDDERRALTRPYGSEQAEWFTGDEASVQRLVGGAFERASVLQFVTHGVLDDERERPAALVLASGLLGARELEELKGAAPALVILTACRSAAEPLRRGDAGAAGLAGAWLAAGAQCVLVADRDLELSSTLGFSAVMHERLAAGASPAEALRFARHAFAGGDPAVKELRAVGLGHRPLFVRAEDAPVSDDANDVRSSRRGLWLVASAALGLGALLLLSVSRRKRAQV